MLKPWLLLGLLLAWVASVGGAFVYGQRTEADSIEAQSAREEQVARKAADAATMAAASAIARLRPINTTIRQETEREVRTNTIYADPGCRHSPEQLQRLNAALTGTGPERAASGVMPGRDAAGR